MPTQEFEFLHLGLKDSLWLLIANLVLAGINDIARQVTRVPALPQSLDDLVSLKIKDI